MSTNSGLFTLYSQVQTKFIDWLWFPYIAYGKVTLLQGDPGDGKSTMMLHLIKEVSRGGKLPDGKSIGEPKRVIYQCSEDGIGDTIKPRLVKMGANLKNIAYINEELADRLTLDDERIRDAIIEFGPKLLVIDPVQAYLGNDSDLQIAGRARRLMHRLIIWAEAYDCAIVLIGHMNKRESAKGLYRGLGSIDIVAAARSVLQVARDPKDPDIRIVSHIKNCLESVGGDIRFEIRPETGFRWLGCGAAPEASANLDGTARDKLSGTKQERAAQMLIEMLKREDVATTEVLNTLAQKDIAAKTARVVKTQLGIKAYRKGGQWYWSMPKART